MRFLVEKSGCKLSAMGRFETLSRLVGPRPHLVEGEDWGSAPASTRAPITISIAIGGVNARTRPPVRVSRAPALSPSAAAASGAEAGRGCPPSRMTGLGSGRRQLHQSTEPSPEDRPRRHPLTRTILTLRSPSVKAASFAMTRHRLGEARIDLGQARGLGRRRGCRTGSRTRRSRRSGTAVPAP